MDTTALTPEKMKHNIFSKFNKVLISLLITQSSTFVITAQQVDYSVTSVPEEAGLDFVQFTNESDYVCIAPVKRSKRGIEWMTNRILSASPNGNELAYLSLRNGLTNIFIKDIDKKGAARQRTNRANVIDFTYSPDGHEICFTENKRNSTQIFTTDAHNGYICRQITSESEDYAPIYSSDMSIIFFTRLEALGMSIWGLDLERKFLASYTSGMNPYPSITENALYVARTNSDKKGEIWKINFDTGIEECIISHPTTSFYSPTVSPDGRKLLLVGGSKIEDNKFVYWNTDIYVCNIDGTDLRQITYHAADDMSPVWSADGKYIYFISQRGNSNGTANVWRIIYHE